MCVSMYMSVQAVTFERLDLGTSTLVVMQTVCLRREIFAQQSDKRKIKTGKEITCTKIPSRFHVTKCCDLILNIVNFNNESECEVEYC